MGPEGANWIAHRLTQFEVVPPALFEGLHEAVHVLDAGVGVRQGGEGAGLDLVAEALALAVLADELLAGVYALH